MAVRRDASGRFLKGEKRLAAKFRVMRSHNWVARTLGATLLLEAEFVMTEAKKQTPVDTGNLRSTGHVDPPEMMGNELTVELGFGGTAAKYALPVHEINIPHKVGKWKYLEDPVNAAQRRLAAALGRDLRYGLKKFSGP